jgi:hypothetical protein
MALATSLCTGFSDLQMRYTGSTDMEMEATSARMANLRVTPRTDKPVAWGERPPKPPAGAAVAPQTPAQPPTPAIFVLPAELMLMVLTQLSHVPDLIRVSAVCRRLRQLALHRRLWRNVEFRDEPRITPSFLHAVAVRYPRMSRLSVQSCKNVNDRAVFSVASACHSLREIDVSDCPYVTFQTLNIILGSLSELRKVNASGCEKNSVELAITRSLPKLQEVLISDCEADDATVISISQHCPNLRKLDVSGSSLISSSALVALMRCTELSSLSFGDISAGGSMGGAEDAMDSDSDTEQTPLGSIKDEHIEMLATSCIGLQDIDITGCGSITGAALAQLLTRCSRLKKQSLRSCDSISDCMFPAEHEGVCGLESLDLQNCGYLTDEAMLNLVLRCPALTDVNLYGCFGLTDDCVGDGAQFGKLQLLNLGNCRIGANGVIQMASSAPDLRVLILGNEHSAEYTGGGRNEPDSMVTDEVFRCLGSHNLKLEHLHVYSSSCSGAGLALLSGGCCALSALTLANCPRMNGFAPMETLPALQSLTLKDSPLSDADIGTLVKATPRLGYFALINPSASVTGERADPLLCILYCTVLCCAVYCTHVSKSHCN